MARRLIVLLVLLALVGLAAGCQVRPSPPSARPSPSASSVVPGHCQTPGHYLAAGRPDPCLTPGQARTADPAAICARGASRAARAELSAAQWTARRRQVERAYGLAVSPGEIDHLLPLEGGGSNALANLWPESAPQFEAKNRAENTLHRAVCRPGMTSAGVGRLQAAWLARWGGVGG